MKTAIKMALVLLFGTLLGLMVSEIRKINGAKGTYPKATPLSENSAPNSQLVSAESDTADLERQLNQKLSELANTPSTKTNPQKATLPSSSQYTNHARIPTGFAISSTNLADYGRATSDDALLTHLWIAKTGNLSRFADEMIPKAMKENWLKSSAASDIATNYAFVGVQDFTVLVKDPISDNRVLYALNVSKPGGAVEEYHLYLSRKSEEWVVTQLSIPSKP